MTAHRKGLRKEREPGSFFKNTHDFELYKCIFNIIHMYIAIIKVYGNISLNNLNMVGGL